MFRTPPRLSLLTTCRLALGVVLLLSPAASLHATLYLPPSPATYTTATSLFNHVIQHDRPEIRSSALQLIGPPPTIASPPPPPPPPPSVRYGPPQQPQHTIGSNLRYLTRSSPAHRSHLASIYAPAPNRPAAYTAGPLQYQPGNGAYRVGPSYAPPTAFNPASLNGGRGPFDLYGLPPLTGHLAAVADLTYILDGRLLKQYLVMEDHDDDNTLDAFLNDPVNRNAYVPFLPHLNFGQRAGPAAAGRPNLGFPVGGIGQTASAAQSARFQQQQQQPQRDGGPFSQQLRQAPAYALGSGSLGFVRHPSGAIYLGSGSLGYINDQQQSDNLQSLRNRQTPGAGPLSFGHTPKK